MAAITASLVKELREKTGAGMMDCKKGPDRNRWRRRRSAVDWLRAKGLSAVEKKSGRVARLKASWLLRSMVPRAPSSKSTPRRISLRATKTSRPSSRKPLISA